MTDTKCTCRPCVYMRRVVLVCAFYPAVLLMWLAGGIIYGLLAGLFFGDMSFARMVRRAWRHTASPSREIEQ